MRLNSEKIQGTYNFKMARRYDFSLPHSFNTWKRKAISNSSLKRGDQVLVFCCGTGLDFLHIQNKIGAEGKIIGVDFSSEMLEKANDRIRKNNWTNIELIEADVTTFRDQFDIKADAGVCTLGMSIIPEYKAAYDNLLSNVKVGGGIIIGDMQLATGLFSRLNPVTVLMAKRYGGTYEGHRNSLELFSIMENTLTNVKKEVYFFGSYCFCIGMK